MDEPQAEATKICGLCHFPKSIADFAFSNKKKNLRQKQCRLCRSKFDSKRHEDSNYRLLLAQKDKRIRIRNREFLSSYLSDKKCKDCNEDDIIVLQFDHLGDKQHGISHMIDGRYSIERIKSEISKCDIVCANCHTRRTAMRAGWYKLSARI